ncbi:hypothetical protein GBW32_16000 [Streptomyces tsukubensis]|uniref:Uncharacterized protein n=1 Tax=Streptomyces tsukubensis TaxID=83656 RepID=A0A1V4A8W7_9ACTN|nr:hypothetical protein B1H18_15670 [Streptomyces tsukubensis]QFR97789.1 hypothetical protein GBW32_16000 [Streptomyces tsukubensis]
MGIDHGVANLERHVTGTPSVAIKSNTRTASSEWRFRRSGRFSGLDNRDMNVLRESSGSGYSQVGAALRAARNAQLTPNRRTDQEAKRPYMSVSKRWTSATPFG